MQKRIFPCVTQKWLFQDNLPTLAQFTQKRSVIGDLNHNHAILLMYRHKTTVIIYAPYEPSKINNISRNMWYTYISHYWHILSHLICPLTCESLGHHWWCDDFPSSCLIHGYLLGPAEGHACPLLDVILSSLPLSTPACSSWHNALQDSFGKTG